MCPRGMDLPLLCNFGPQMLGIPIDHVFANTILFDVSLSWGRCRNVALAYRALPQWGSRTVR